MRVIVIHLEHGTWKSAYPFDAEKTDTVLHLKNCIRTKISQDTSQMRLFYGTKLDDTRTLGEYQIGNLSYIWLVVA